MLIYGKRRTTETTKTTEIELEKDSMCMVDRSQRSTTAAAVRWHLRFDLAVDKLLLVLQKQREVVLFDRPVAGIQGLWTASWMDSE
jgi:hypothetical protein